MAQDSIYNDLLVVGNISAKGLTLTTASITDAMVVAAAGLQASKLQHQYTQVYAQPGANNAGVERKVIHVVRGATATVLEFKVGARVAATGNATATIDCYRNGATILTGTITLDSTTAAYILKAGTLAAFSPVAGDVFETVVTAVNPGTGTLAQGLFAYLTVREDAQ
jgi:hypothetical protein